VRRRWVLALGLGCSLPDVDVEGVHVRVAADPGLALCGGTLTHMDAFVARMAEEFWIAAPTGDDRIEFFWLTVDEFASRSGCGPNTAGCAHVGTVYSWAAPLNHEFVHALDWRPGGVPHFFEEGMAAAFQGLGRVTGNSVASSQGYVERYIEARTPMAVDYATAGAFVRFLVEHHGMDGAVRMMERLSRRTTLAEVDAAFQAELGVTLADSIDAFDLHRLMCPQDRTALLLECDAPEIAWDGVVFAEYRALACEQEDVVGPFEGRETVVLRTLEVREDGIYEVNAIADGGAFTVSLVDCGGCGPRVAVRAGEVAAFELTAGLYSVRLHGSAVAPTDVGWQIRRR